MNTTIRTVLMAAAFAAAFAAFNLGGSALAALPADGKSPHSEPHYNPDRQESITTKTWDLGEGARLLDIQSSNGAISVEGWDRPMVELVITKKINARGGWLGWFVGDRVTDAQAQAALENLEVSTLVSEGVVQVRTRELQDTGIDVDLHLGLRVPRDTAQHLMATNGRIAVKGISAMVQVHTENGELALADIKGDIHARTGNGAVRLANIDGDIHATSENGAIDCDGASGVVQLTTTNGAINARGADKVSLACRTENGAIAVTYPSGAAHSLDLTSHRGSVNCSAPLDDAAHNGGQQVRGTVRGGGAMISLNTSNGSITLGEE